jgi:hypothetical protein
VVAELALLPHVDGGVMTPRRMYLRGEAVTVLAIGGGHGRGKRHGEPKSPVNALVQLADGRRLVRPFRGLRRAP